MHFLKIYTFESILAFSLCTLLLSSCKKKVNPQVNIDKTKNALVNEYLRLNDSLVFFDTTEMEFLILKTYMKNDTERLKSHIERFGERYFQKDTLLLRYFLTSPKRLSDYDFDEAYRYLYFAPFSGLEYFIVIGRKDTVVTMDFQWNKKRKFDLTISEPTDRIKVTLTRKDWNEFKNAINYADFWGMQYENYKFGFDGSALYVSGYISESCWQGRPLNKTIYRWNADQTAIFEPLMILLSKSRQLDKYGKLPKRPPMPCF